jgi:pyroglutamyl-peptidase
VVLIILVTGFRPYSVFKRNPSGEIAELLDGSYFSGNEVVGLSLEVKHSYLRKQYLQQIKKGYDVIINTCLSPGRNAITIEKMAINWQDDIRDEEGIAPRVGKIVEDGPDCLPSRIPAEGILEALRSNKIPSEISFTAGAFVCNKILYYSLYFTKSRAGLIHFPLETESSLDGRYPTMNIDHMIRSVEIAIQKTI